MEFYDLLKIKINELQFHIDRDSNMQLIIFDNPNLLDNYIKLGDKKAQLNKKLITLNELCYSNALDGLKFRNYWFITEQEINDILKRRRQ